MPAETFLKTGTNVADTVKRQFGDPDGRQITNNDILGWINTAQQEIVSQNPILKATLENTTTAGTDLYEYPTALIQYIEAIHYDGIPLESFSFQEAQDRILAYAQGGVGNSTPQIWYERDGKIYLYPKPDAAKTLRLFYVKRPADLASLTETLKVPDRYFQRVVDHCLARAYQLDENWEAAQYKQTEFFNGMALLQNQEHVGQRNTYPSITVRPEDM